METKMRENHGERDRFHCNNGDYNGVLWSARILGSIDPPHCIRRDLLFIQAVSVRIRLQSSALFKYL